MPIDTITNAESGLIGLTRKILESEDFPACSQNIQSVLKLAASPDASIPSFSSVVLKDVALSLRVLQAANTALYNRAGKTILSVSHATALLGLDIVVQIAAGLKVIEGFARTKPGMRELATLSLLSASQARQLAIVAGYPRSEEAYLCGLLRNLGEMLVAFYKPQEYAYILVSVEEDRSDFAAVSRRVLQFEFEDLAIKVLEGWGLNGAAVECLQATASSAVHEPPTDTNTLYMISSVSHLLTTAIHRRPESEARVAVRSILERFGRRLKLTDSDLKTLLDMAVAETRDIFAGLGISLNSLKYQRQVERAMALLEDRTVETERLTSTLVQLENLLTVESDFDLTLFLLSVLEALVQSGSYDRALFALVDTRRKLVLGKLARGGGMEEQVRFFCYPLLPTDNPVGQTLLRGEDHYADVTREPKLADTPLVAAYNPASFAILPIQVRGILVACLYLDRLHPGSPLNREERIAVGRLRDIMGLAMGRKRG